MDYKISEELQQKLDNINWESLSEKYGISKDYVYSNQTIASQLATVSLLTLSLPETTNSQAWYHSEPILCRTPLNGR